MSVECTKIIVVLGMHRSGTSAITRALETLGVSLGGNLMPPAADNNEKGFFEDLDIHDFNTRLLTDLGSAWDRLEPVRPEQLVEGVLASHLEEATFLLRGKLQGAQVFAFKDPQTALLLPFWQQVLLRLALDVRYLICLRNPLSVSASLHKRDGIDLTRGHLLWAKYQLAALCHTHGQPRLLVDYDALMEQPQQQLQRIARAFDLPPPESDPQALASFCQEFLAAGLRHSQYSDTELADPDRVLRQVRMLHVLLRQAAEDRLDLQAASTLASCAQLVEELGGLQPLSRSIDLLDQERLRLDDLLGERERELARLGDELGCLDNELNRLRDELGELRTQHHLVQGECHNAWSMHDRALRDKHELGNELLNSLQRQAELREELVRVYASRSWRTMRPLRGLRRHYRNPLLLLRSLASESVRALWQLSPFSTAQKQRLKGVAFTYGRVLFARTQAYRNWQWMNAIPTETPLPESREALVLIDEPVQQVRRLQDVAPIKPPARLIAFYLPQFHPIEENNQWWGDGFTEWTNVKPALPQYLGHYQPHVPGDLGYYDLEEVETQRRQVELAKLYGLGGFCFYFYWFAGKRLLENPLEQYLQNPSLDLPFCLCWANENWSRRWDGLDSHVLIGQDHSAEDDLAFIAYVAKYMRDERYIRIDGKPLLLVYRPGLLPDAKNTAQRWRTWCLENGLGEIYLAYTQSFDNVAPAKYGFDAAIEFPPNATQPPVVTHKIEPLSGDFAGQVFDWSIYPKRSANYAKPPYKLFRGVCPAWDNTARRKNHGTSFINSSPRGYQEWLFNAIQDTLQHSAHADERLVFINAWNEWAEGAHLEPDQRYGYGYLEATRMASLRVNLQQYSAPGIAPLKLAVLIHAYYPEVFREILDYLQRVEGLALKLYVSCPAECSRTIASLLEGCNHDYQLEQLPNHGRDVLPFLKLLPCAIEEGFEYILKVHTKKSTHRTDGDVWRQDLYDKLLTEQAMRSALDTFASNPSTGILGPDGHLVPMSFYWGANAHAVEKLACRLGIRPGDLADLNFVAGTMFFAQVRALQPLLGLALNEEDFETEAGQVDGTLAHALERAMSVSALAAGLGVRSCTALVAQRDYAFAEAVS